MATGNGKYENAKITLSVAGLNIPDANREEWERSVETMAKMAELLSCLDPMDDEPITLFDPRF